MEEGEHTRERAEDVSFAEWIDEWFRKKGRYQESLKKYGREPLFDHDASDRLLELLELLRRLEANQERTEAGHDRTILLASRLMQLERNSVAHGRVHTRSQHNLNRLTLVDDFDPDRLLSPDYVAKTVVPYLEALSDLQAVIDVMRGVPRHPVHIRSLRQLSPISVDLQGAVDAVEVVRDEVVPWRREHGKKIATLQEEEKALSIKQTEAEIQEKQAKAEKASEEVKQEREQSRVASLKARAEVERMLLENEALRVEIQERQINLALTVIEKVNPDLSQEQRIAFVISLLGPLQVLTENPLRLAAVDGDLIDEAA